MSPVSDVAEAQTGWPTEDEFPEGARSPGVDLADVVAGLQKEVKDFRSESGYDCFKKTVIPPQPSGWAGFTSMTVPMFAGMTSWDQSRQVFEVRDRFIAGQVGCTLRRHLDSVEPETPILDIVDRCRVWESHAEFMDHRGDSPTPRQPLLVYTIDDAGTGNGQSGVTADITPEDQ